MSIFDIEGRIDSDWSDFLDSFPSIGAFKLFHGMEVAFVDKNLVQLLQLKSDRIPKEELFTFIDALRENSVEGHKNIYRYSFDGENIYINVKIVHQRDSLLGFVQDVTQSMQALQGGEDASSLDGLTGLYNRNFFIKKVRQAVSEISGKAQCCMAVAHINGIERIDSELNYDKTELCISSAARALKKFVSDDTIIGVKSYKDFYIFFRQTSKNEVLRIFRKMSESMEHCRITDEFGNEIETRSGSFSLTMGYCWYPHQAATMDMMINYADFALFSAMSSGHTDCEFNPDEYIAEQSNYSDSKALSGLIDENQFLYKFQPIVSAIDGTIYGYEALMRPESTTPLEVLRIAREHGKLYDIELLTFENVLARVKEDKAYFAGRKVFINSVPDYMLKEFDFYRLCEKYRDIMPQVVIELTEQSDLTDENIARLKDIYCTMGCMIALDDYGSGYSNSAAVLSLAPDIIKIDRTLISEINTNTRKQHFLSGIIDFAKLNGIKVLAEGVETQAEMKVVIRRGVDLIQGFYTARPTVEIQTEISSNITEGIRAVNINKPEIRIPKVLEVKPDYEDLIDLDELSDSKYTNITVTGPLARMKSEKGKPCPIAIKIADNITTYLIFDNANIQGSVLPCIVVGEHSSVTVEIRGKNIFSYDGISVPDSSDVTIVGDGELFIDSYRNNGCCIGAAYNEPFGKITVDLHSEGVLRMRANGDHALCLGGGITSRENAINLKGGKISATCTGADCIGIGCYDGSCTISAENCLLEIMTSGDNSVCVGSVCGTPDVKLFKAKLHLEALGVNACCVGTLALVNDKERISLVAQRSDFDIVVKSQIGFGIGSRKQDSDIQVLDCKGKIYFEGDIVASIGSIDASGSICIDGSNLSLASLAGPRSIYIGMASNEVSVHNCIINDVAEEQARGYMLKAITL